MIVTTNIRQTDYIDVNIKMLGENVEIGWHSTVWADEVGDNTRIGRFVEVQERVKVGKNSKIGSYCFIPEGVTIGDNCFIGPRCTFTNDKHPFLHWPEKRGWTPEATWIADHAVIGAGAVILPVKICEGSVIGAGAVLTKNVGPGEIWAGNPARKIGKVWPDGSFSTKEVKL